MSRVKPTLLAALGLALLASASAEAGWLHYANSVFTATKNAQTHPQSVSQVIVLPREAVDAILCMGYSNTADAKSKGRVVSTATILRADGGEQVLNFAGGVKANTYLNCQDAGDLQAGDVVEVDHDLKGMPRLSSNNGPAQFADVLAVVSTAGEPRLGTVPFGLNPIEDGGWIHSTSSVFEADRKKQKHPESLAQTLVITQNVDNPYICAAYNNIANKKNKGRVVSSANIVRESGITEKLSFAGGVSRNEYLKCKSAGGLVAGDMIEFDFELQNFPRLSAGSDGDEFANIFAAVSDAGLVDFRRPPAPDVPDAPAPTATPPPAGTPAPAGNPAPSAGISADDQRAVSGMFQVKSQLWRPKGNSPSKWVVVGPKTVAISGNTLNLSTAGLGSTIAAAYNDYQRKRGGLPGGGLLDSRTLNAINWYGSMNASGGPTSVRRDSAGGFHSEYWRARSGSVFNKGGSIAAVIELLQRQGL
jgi:hypothetical protein